MSTNRTFVGGTWFRTPRAFIVAALCVGLVASNPAVKASAETTSTRIVLEQTIRIPAAGSPLGLVTRLCFPTVAANKRVRLSQLVVINHGSPPVAADRATYTPWKCNSQAATFFLQRGYAVAFPVRRGYGATVGVWVEAFGACDSADFVKGGLGTASDIASTVNFLHTFPGIAPTGTIVVGHSAGGFGTIAYASMRPVGVRALINVAGGRGGHAGSADDDSTCSPARLAATAGEFGKTARLPMLWLYADNDGFFSPDLVDWMYTEFTDAGGSADLQTVDEYSTDGHRLFGSGGVEVWGPIVQRFLQKL